MFSRGFTLIELMVTVAIFVFMTALLLANYNGFSQGTLLANTAYDIATTVRLAQSYGTSVLQDQNANFTSAYGVELSTTNSPLTGGATPTKIILFQDTNSDGMYDGVSANVLKSYSLKNGAYIKSLKVCPKNYTIPSSGCTTLASGYVDITFQRPNPEATIAWNWSGSSVAIDTTAGYVFATLSSGNGADSRTVEIQHNGQISVTN